MPSKLGPHIQRMSGLVDDLVAALQPGVIKVIDIKGDDLRRLMSRNPKSMVIYRDYQSEHPDEFRRRVIEDPIGTATTEFIRLEEYGLPEGVYVETRNEFFGYETANASRDGVWIGGSQLEQIDIYMATFAQFCLSRNWGCVPGNMGVGNGEGKWFHWMKNTLRLWREGQGRVIWGFHEYDWPHIFHTHDLSLITSRPKIATANDPVDRRLLYSTGREIKVRETPVTPALAAMPTGSEITGRWLGLRSERILMELVREGLIQESDVPRMWSVITEFGVTQLLSPRREGDYGFTRLNREETGGEHPEVYHWNRTMRDYDEWAQDKPWLLGVTHYMTGSEDRAAGPSADWRTFDVVDNPWINNTWRRYHVEKGVSYPGEVIAAAYVSPPPGPVDPVEPNPEEIVLPTPSNLRVVAGGHDFITYAWDLAPGDYQVNFYRIVGSETRYVHSVGSEEHESTLGGLEPGAYHTIVLTTSDARSESAPTPPFVWGTTDAPITPEPANELLRLKEIVRTSAAKYGIEWALADKQVMQESGYDPSAESGSGAVGLIQLMPATARNLGLRVDDEVDERLDPLKNVDAGHRFLKYCIDSFTGDQTKGFASYNAGVGAMRKWVGEYGASWRRMLRERSDTWMTVTAYPLWRPFKAIEVADYLDSILGPEVREPAVVITPPTGIVFVGSPFKTIGRRGHKPVALVYHIMDGTLYGCDSWFNNPAAQVSAHFGIGKKNRGDGLAEIHQYVSTKDSAWANGRVNRPDTTIPWLKDAIARGINPNDLTISIELEGKPGDYIDWPQWNAAVELGQYCVRTYGIPIDRTHVIGHNRIDSVDRARCPGLDNYLWGELLKGLARTD